MNNTLNNNHNQIGKSEEDPDVYGEGGDDLDSIFKEIKQVRESSQHCSDSERRDRGRVQFVLNISRSLTPLSPCIAADVALKLWNLIGDESDSEDQ